MNRQVKINTTHRLRRGSAARSRARRTGNTLVLVAGILVLLVIVATAYITRTQSQRVVSVSTNTSQQTGDNLNLIAEKIARETADALFPWGVDPADPLAAFDFSEGIVTGVGDANYPRRGPRESAVRFAPDPLAPHNRPSYHTVPWTNLPDPDWIAGLDPARWPLGAGNTDPDAGTANTVPTAQGQREANAALLSTETNPLGNPGTNDTRWLADSEPLRWDTSAFPLPGNLVSEGVLDAFSHWRKMTNLARANNSIRVIGDIANVEGTIVTNLNLPIEQWPVRPPRLSNVMYGGSPNPAPFNAQTGNVNVNWLMGGTPRRFWNQWNAWFGFSNDYFGHEESRLNLNVTPLAGTPPNFYKLNDLDGDGLKYTYVIGGVPQDRPESEFIPDTARNIVSRVLADADGDGFTDSFWFTTPTPIRNGVRQIMAVRIVDNSAMLNANVATRMLRRNFDTLPGGGYSFNAFYKTRAHTPADLALVGQTWNEPTDNSWNVGLYDNFVNWSDHLGNLTIAQYRSPGSAPVDAYELWQRHLDETGLTDFMVSNGNNSTAPSQFERLDYWRRSGRHGLSSLPANSPYTAFGLADELELRLFHGNNSPWILSRYEFTTQGNPSGTTEGTPPSGAGILRANLDREESNEYLKQLNNRDLVRDNRRKLTLYSGARNDELPPWLRWEERFVNLNTLSLSGAIPTGFFPFTIENQLEGASSNADLQRRILDQFLAQSRRKLDLREQEVSFAGLDPDDAPGNFAKYYGYELITGGTGYPVGYPDYRLPLYPVPGVAAERFLGRLNFRERLAPMLLMALSDVVEQEVFNDETLYETYAFGTYYGPYQVSTSASVSDEDGMPVVSVNEDDDALLRTRHLAAGLAANILSYRDRYPAKLTDRVLLPEVRLQDDKYFPPGQEDFVNLASWSGTTADPVGHLALTPQPFLVEAFIAHVYAPSENMPPFYVPDATGEGVDCGTLDPDAPPPISGVEPYDNYDSALSQQLIFDNGNSDPHRSTIVVVQIANPFDVPIDLSEYRIDVFGQEYELSNMTSSASDKRWLQPATHDRPATAIFYAMEDHIDDISGMEDEIDTDDKWRAFLDIVVQDPNRPVEASDTDIDLAPGTIVHRVVNEWETDDRQEHYDRRDSSGNLIPVAPDDNTITLLRRDESLASGTPDWVLIDRFDPPTGEREFAIAVNNMYTYRPPDAPTVQVCEFAPPDANGDYPTYVVESGEHWVQWVRATRAWGMDLNGSSTTDSDNNTFPVYEAHERNPRFVFGDRAVIVPSENGTPDDAGGESSFVRARNRSDGEPSAQVTGNEPGGNRYDFGSDPNGPPGTPSPWFARAYYDTFGLLRDYDPSGGGTPPTGRGEWRKPTFFSMGYRDELDPGETDEELRPFFMPDKGWYGQYKLRTLLGETLDELTAAFTLSDLSLMRLVGVGTVDYPPILDGDTEFVYPQVTNSLPPATPRQYLVRMPFALRMNLKNKHAPWDYVNGSSFPSGISLADTLLNREFEQLGELANVFLFGHQLEMNITGQPHSPTTETYERTMVTFSEFMGAEHWRLSGAMPEELASPAVYNAWVAENQPQLVNRLRLKPIQIAPTPATTDPDDYAFFGDVIGRPRLLTVGSQGLAQLARAQDPRQGYPALPAGARVFDALVCDGPGRMVYNENPGVDSVINQLDVELASFYNANGFEGRITPGLININTAMPEVLAALPHLSKLVHEDFVPSDLPYSSLPWAIQRYRERIGTPGWEAAVGSPIPPLHFGSPSWGSGGNPAAKLDLGPAYAHRGRPSVAIASPGAPNSYSPFFVPGDAVAGFVPGLRGERGFASIGELGLLTQSGRSGKAPESSSPPSSVFIYDNLNADAAFTAIDINNSWRIDYAAMPERFRHLLDRSYDYNDAANPLAYLFSDEPATTIPGVQRISLSARLGTDTIEDFNEYEFTDGVGSFGGYLNGFYPDAIAEDAREANLLLAGISNLVTTRSDVFTVYFRVRTFRQNPVTGVWDATDPDQIIDDSRYVMLVDRSEVNRPTDQPKILFLEKAP